MKARIYEDVITKVKFEGKAELGTIIKKGGMVCGEYLETRKVKFDGDDEWLVRTISINDIIESAGDDS